MRTALFLALIGCAAQPPGVGESDLSSASPSVCDGARFPIAVSPLTKNCCQLGNETWHIGPANGAVVHRIFGPPCTLSDGSPDCVGQDCFYGPCGANNLSVTGGPPSYIFKPRSNPAVCGWQAGGTSGAYDPEPYTDQELWPNIASACPWTSCPGGGLPAVSLTVVAVENGATGKVESDPVGIDFEGAGTATSIFTQLDVGLKAKGTGHHTRAVFSGDCSATGDYGQIARCDLTLGPNKKVTVTYEREPGYDR